MRYLESFVKRGNGYESTPSWFTWQTSRDKAVNGISPSIKEPTDDELDSMVRDLRRGKKPAVPKNGWGAPPNSNPSNFKRTITTNKHKTASRVGSNG